MFICAQEAVSSRRKRWLTIRGYGFLPNEYNSHRRMAKLHTSDLFVNFCKQGKNLAKSNKHTHKDHEESVLKHSELQDIANIANLWRSRTMYHIVTQCVVCSRNINWNVPTATYLMKSIKTSSVKWSFYGMQLSTLPHSSELSPVTLCH